MMRPSSGAEAISAAEWTQQARRFLEQASTLPGAPEGRRGLSFAEASLEAQVILGHVLGRPRAWLLAHPETIPTAQQVEQLASLLERLASGEPLPYLLGEAAFFGLDFLVNPAVLIPRPETELLVEQALAWLGQHPLRRLAADVGTGSGCIAVSLAKHAQRLGLLAVDSSDKALAVARSNAIRHAVTQQITFLRGSLLEFAAGPFDLVCANLPYIPSEPLAGLQVARFEPQLALDGGPDGLTAIRALLADAPRWLAPGGLLLLEMQFDQGAEISDLAQLYLPGACIFVLNDLAGLPRLVRIEQSGQPDRRKRIL